MDPIVKKFFFSGSGDIPGGPGFVSTLSGWPYYIDKDGDGTADIGVTPRYCHQLSNGNIVWMGSILDNSIPPNNTAWRGMHGVLKMDSSGSNVTTYSHMRANTGDTNMWDMQYGTVIGNYILGGEYVRRGPSYYTGHVASYDCSGATPSLHAAKNIDANSSSGLKGMGTRWVHPDKTNSGRALILSKGSTNIISSVDTSLSVQWQLQTPTLSAGDFARCNNNASGDIAFGGLTGGYRGTNKYSPWVLKFNSSGTASWGFVTYVTADTTSSWTQCVDVLMHSSGDVFCMMDYYPSSSSVNNMIIKYDGTNGNIVWMREYSSVDWPNVSMVEDANGDIIIGYSPTAYGGGFNLIKMDTDGNEIWGRLIYNKTNSPNYYAYFNFKILMTPSDDIMITVSNQSPALALLFDNALGVPVTQSLGGSDIAVSLVNNATTAVTSTYINNTFTSASNAFNLSTYSGSWSNVSNLSQVNTISGVNPSSLYTFTS